MAQLAGIGILQAGAVIQANGLIGKLGMAVVQTGVDKTDNLPLAGYAACIDFISLNAV